MSMIVDPKIRVLFVCTGNICRSPMAEAVFQHLVNLAGLPDRFEISSAATSVWEIGEPVHPGTRLVLRNHHISISPSKRAVQITPSDYQNYDYILAMDMENMNSLRRSGKVQRLMDFAPTGTRLDVPDPYYTGDFETVYEMISSACQSLLVQICAKEKI
jgi:protein-tyrosine phosphatase